MAEWKISPPAPPEYLAALRDIHLLTAYARGLTDAEAEAAAITIPALDRCEPRPVTAHIPPQTLNQ